MMARHRTALGPRERVRVGVRWASRVATWLALGALVGGAAWVALTWAGSRPEVTRWAAAGTGALTAVAAAVAHAASPRDPSPAEGTAEGTGPGSGPGTGDDADADARSAS